jgi:hypothetical protein
MPLNLTDPARVQTVFNGGISVDNMTWWFWIKAGMGFTFGAAIAMITWGLVIFAFVLGLGLAGAILGGVANTVSPHTTLRR